MNENSSLLIVCPEGLNADASFSEPMDTGWKRSLATLQTELESLLDTRLEGKVVVEAQREEQPHKEGEVTLQKIRQEFESVVRQREDQTEERLKHQLYVSEGYKEIARKQVEIQQQLQLWGEELRHGGNAECSDQPQQQRDAASCDKGGPAREEVFRKKIKAL